MPLRLGTEMPELTGATEWLNGEEPTREALTGSPTLVHFWAVSCYICKDNMPTLEEWKRAYGPQGLKLVAVHMPRQESDLNVAQVKATLEEFRVEEPCAVDNEHAIGDRFQTAGLWPHYFLFDAEGNLRGRSAGNAGLGMIESALKRMLDAEPVPA
ncbi:MAG TPA: TlpA disulfide reductase family protein [Armatimonadaceae bacterium]|jgi:thiol-disulfide isomerase/thioredoxin|nr:TlpA disulfide reductase family protein [Armatimonadaceae bacterium]